MATHSSILVWRSCGQRSLGGYSPRGHKESNMTEQLSRHTQVSMIKLLKLRDIQC